MSRAATTAAGTPVLPPGSPFAGNADFLTCSASPFVQSGFLAIPNPYTGHFEWNSAAVAASGNPSGLSGQEIVLYDYRQRDERKPLTIRAGVAEGFVPRQVVARLAGTPT